MNGDVSQLLEVRKFLTLFREHLLQFVKYLDSYLAPIEIPEERKIEIPTEARELVAVPPAITYVRTEPFNDHFFTVCPKKLNHTGDFYDLGKVWDLIILIPSVDAQIEFDKPVETSTPVLSGGLSFKVGLKARTIYFKAASETVEGKLSIWAFGYK